MGRVGGVRVFAKGRANPQPELAVRHRCPELPADLVELLRHFQGRMGPSARFDRQRLAQDDLQRVGDPSGPGDPGQGPLPLLGRDGQKRFVDRSSMPQRSPQQRIRQDHARRIDVRAEAGRSASDLFGRDVARLPPNGLGTGLVRRVPELCDAEVHQLHFAVEADQDVARTHVPVDQAQGTALPVLGGVGRVQAPQHVPHHPQGDPQGKPAVVVAGPLQGLMEAPALHVLHGDVRPPVHHRQIEDLDDVRVVQAGHQPGLSEKQATQGRVGFVVRQEGLEHDPPSKPAKPFQIGQKQFAHPALMQRPDDFITTFAAGSGLIRPKGAEVPHLGLGAGRWRCRSSSHAGGS